MLVHCWHNRTTGCYIARAKKMLHPSVFSTVLGQWVKYMKPSEHRLKDIWRHCLLETIEPGFVSCLVEMYEMWNVICKTCKWMTLNDSQLPHSSSTTIPCKTCKWMTLNDSQPPHSSSTTISRKTCKWITLNDSQPPHSWSTTIPRKTSVEVEMLSKESWRSWRWVLWPILYWSIRRLLWRRGTVLTSRWSLLRSSS